MKKMLFSINPVTARTAVTPHLINVIDLFEKSGYRVTVHITKSHGELSDLILERGEKYDIVVSAGGDGTLNETISPVLKLKKKPVIGFIPSGTTNDFATGWKLPRNPLKAAQKIVSGSPTGVDVGVINGMPFIYVAACGVFSDIPYKTPQQQKKNLGYAAYLAGGIKSLTTHPPFYMELEHDGRKVSGEYYLVMISNSRRVGGFDLKFKNDAKLDDGLLEVTMVKKPVNPIESPAVLGAVIFQDLNSDYIYYTQAKEIKIRSEIPLEWTVDGEQGDTCCEASIEVLRDSVKMMI